MRTFCRFGLKRRRVATIEWLREFPNAGPLRQLKQTLAMARWMVAVVTYARPWRSSAIRITATAALRP
jgi:hypothetical protein